MKTQKLTDAERLAILEKKIEIAQSGYGGVLGTTLEIVDRREHPEAIPFQYNPMMNTPHPKKL